MPRLDYYVIERRQSGICEVCGNDINTHPQCTNCGILIGKGHEEPSSFDGKCGTCNGRNWTISEYITPSHNYVLRVPDSVKREINSIDIGTLGMI